MYEYNVKNNSGKKSFVEMIKNMRTWEPNELPVDQQKKKFGSTSTMASMILFFQSFDENNHHVNVRNYKIPVFQRIIKIATSKILLAEITM